MSTVETPDVRTRPLEGNTTMSHTVMAGPGHARLTSNELVKTIRVGLSHIENQIRNHVFLEDLRERRVDLYSLKAFPGNQYHIIKSDIRSVAMLVDRFPDPSVQPFFKQVLQGDREALDNIVILARRLGMSVEELQWFPFTPESFAYATCMSWLSTHASAAEVVAGFLVNFPAWGHNCGRMSKSLKDHYEFMQEDTAFLDAYANMPSFESVALDIIQDGLDAGVNPVDIQRAAFLFQGYEKMFWDAMAKVGNV